MILLTSLFILLEFLLLGFALCCLVYSNRRQK